jgi:UDP-N-acetylmuramate--alanine ligase
MNLNTIHNIYFIGIGGIGMSALARYFKANKKHVAGYDKTRTDITSDLTDLDIQIHFEDAVELIEEMFLNPNTTLGLYTGYSKKPLRVAILFK